MRAYRPALALIFALVTSARVASAQTPDTAVTLTFGGFVDSYYAWDFGRPPSFDRSFAGGAPFTTQPARHNEFNVNLAFLEAKISGGNLRGRLALQAGTSVQSNYSGEPTSGAISGPTLSRHIQEAVVGVRIAPSVWIDGGIFFSHMGMEGWVSRDNPTYTRSLVAEYSPYYQSGVKLTWAPSPTLTAQVDVVNGWQNISENNSGKGIGARLDWTPTSAVALSYYNFFSSEAGTRLRTFNGVGVKATTGRTSLLGQFDIGTQEKSAADGQSASWFGLTAIGRLQLSTATALAARVEHFQDPDQVVIATGRDADVPNGSFHGWGASLGIDISPQSRVRWRSELRGFRNRSSVFPDGPSGAPAKSTALVVTSLAVTF